MSVTQKRAIKKRNNTEEKESKGLILNTCSLDRSESKMIHISVNTVKVKDENNE